MVALLRLVAMTDSIMKKYKLMVHIDGKCIDDILRLPCVKGCSKTATKDVYKFLFFPHCMAHPTTMAYTGDWICQDYDGKWYIEKKTNKNFVD